MIDKDINFTCEDFGYNCEYCDYLIYDDNTRYCDLYIHRKNLMLRKRIEELEQENRKLLKQIEQMEVYR